MIDVVLLDIDGILTDGAVHVDVAGQETKRLHFDDIDALFELKRAGLKIGFITGEDNAFCEFVRKRFEPELFMAGSKDKLGDFKKLATTLNLSPARVCYAGDSQKDAALLRHVGLGLAPSDAAPAARQAAHVVLGVARGQGVVREVASRVLALNHSASENSTAFWLKRIDEHLQTITLLRQDGELIERLSTAALAVVRTFQNGGKVLLCGNGGSSTDAQHIAAEFIGRFFRERAALFAEALGAEISSLTCIANDYSYDDVFARQVEAKGRAGDVLIGITTSGNSKNVVRALEIARRKGLITIVLTGENRTTATAALGDHCLHVPSRSTPRIQEGHILIGHLLCEFVEERLFGATEANAG